MASAFVVDSEGHLDYKSARNESGDVQVAEDFDEEFYREACEHRQRGIGSSDPKYAERDGQGEPLIELCGSGANLARITPASGRVPHNASTKLRSWGWYKGNKSPPLIKYNLTNEKPS